MTNPQFKAKVLSSDELLKVTNFINKETPGNVGICLSGGGSRALSAGMGQLRALSYLKTKNGKTLLEQTKAISTVSGGSWVGATFMYLDPTIKNDEYLNKYVPDQSKLTISKSKTSKDEEILTLLPPNNIGSRIIIKFSPMAFLGDLITLHKEGVPTSMLWQTIIGDQILNYYKLFPLGDLHSPKSSFTYSTESLNDIITQNPTLGQIPFALNTTAQPNSDPKPAFIICNAAMFVTITGEKYQYLAPLQSTPFYTGIFSSPDCVDINNQPIGGNGVSSFGFNSLLSNIDKNTATINQDRQWSLADIIGTSSAFFASVLEERIAIYLKSPSQFISDMHTASCNGELDTTQLPTHLKLNANSSNGSELATLRAKLQEDLEKAKNDAENDFESFLCSTGINGNKFIEALKALTDLVPQYNFWSNKDNEPGNTTKQNRFADAGNLENMGIAALLSYTDIDKIISFINSSTALSFASTKQCLVDANNIPIPNTNVIVDSQIPPLFGFQPYYKETGYVSYNDTINHDDDKIFKYNQIFKSEDFATFLQQLVKVTGDNLSTNCAVINISLDVLENKWFGISNREKVEFIFVYTNEVKTWKNILNKDVQNLLTTSEFKTFPHYSTFNTQLSTKQINLLSNLTAWCVANDSNAASFINLYETK